MAVTFVTHTHTLHLAHFFGVVRNVCWPPCSGRGKCITTESIAQRVPWSVTIYNSYVTVCNNQDTLNTVKHDNMWNNEIKESVMRKPKYVNFTAHV